MAFRVFAAGESPEGSGVVVIYTGTVLLRANGPLKQPRGDIVITYSELDPPAALVVESWRNPSGAR